MSETSKSDSAKTADAAAAAAGAMIKAAVPAADAAQATARAVAAETVKSAKAVAAKGRRASRKPATRKAVRKPARKAAARAASQPNKTAARKLRAKAPERTETMTKKSSNAFNFTPFDNVPGFQPLTTLISDTSERGQELARKSQKVAEQMADLTRANVEAMVEAGKIAAEGSKALGRDMIAKGRNGVEQASDAIRSLAEAKSPTEFVQLQSEYARASFDRMVADSSKFAEAMVKLAGETFQPLQNRASATAQRLNTFVA